MRRSFWAAQWRSHSGASKTSSNLGSTRVSKALCGARGSLAKAFNAPLRADKAWGWVRVFG